MKDKLEPICISTLVTIIGTPEDSAHIEMLFV